MPLHSEAIKSRKVNLQLLYIIFCWFITAIALFLYSSFLQNFIPSSNFQLELLIAGGQLLYMGMFLADKNKTILLDYLRNLMTVSLLGAIALLFMSLISMFIHFTPIIYLLYFMFMAAAMFFEHFRRVKSMNLPGYLCIAWASYRVLVLLLIFI